jgi:hypothetical protein
LFNYCSTGVWTQGFILTSQVLYPLSHTPILLCCSFQIGSHTAVLLPVPPTYLGPQMCAYTQSVVGDTFFPRLVSSHNLPDLHLLNSCDYSMSHYSSKMFIILIFLQKINYSERYIIGILDNFHIFVYSLLILRYLNFIWMLQTIS